MNRKRVVINIQRFFRGFMMGLSGLIGGVIAIGSVLLMGIVAVGLFLEMIFGEYFRLMSYNKKTNTRIKNNYKKLHSPKGWKDGARRVGL